MSVETKQEQEAQSPFGSKKVTQAEVAMYVTNAIQATVLPLKQRTAVLQNALDTLYAFLAEVGLNGAKITQEEIVAYVKSKNNQTAGKPPANGAQA